ncbi:MAG: hypothetical protein WCR52_04115 [Bacteroidota bacterium]
MGEEYPSPDGKYILRLGCNEMRMSHWVCSPDLFEVETATILYEAPSDHDASGIKWSDDSREVRFFMRVYPGSTPGKNAVLKISNGKAILEYEA